MVSKLVDTKVVARRVWAHLIDLFLPGFVWAAVLALSIEIAITFDVSADDYRNYFGDWFDAVGYLVALSLNWLVLQGLTGYSLGKVLLHIRVVDSAGKPPGLVRAVKRSLPLVLEQLGLVALWAMRRHPRNQRYGDRWAHTFVVRSGGLAPVVATTGERDHDSRDWTPAPDGLGPAA